MGTGVIVAVGRCVGDKMMVVGIGVFVGRVVGEGVIDGQIVGTGVFVGINVGIGVEVGFVFEHSVPTNVGSRY